jgi:hypothetical protein
MLMQGARLRVAREGDPRAGRHLPSEILRSWLILPVNKSIAAIFMHEFVTIV